MKSLERSELKNPALVTR